LARENARWGYRRIDLELVTATVEGSREPGCVSYMRTATTRPDNAVIAATTEIAEARPNRSATTPESSAPAAKPRSRQNL
jgi:hypothetical protein